MIAGANCPLTYAGVDLGGWNIRCISKRRDDNEARQAAIWRREGIDYATGHVSRWPVVAAVRWLRVWDLYQPRRQVMFAEGRQRRVEQAGVVAYGLLALLALGGVAVLWRARRRDALLVLLAPAVVVSVACGGRLRRAAAAPRLRDADARARGGRARGPVGAAARRVRFSRALALAAAGRPRAAPGLRAGAGQVQAAARRRAGVPPAGQPAGRRQGLHPAVPLRGHRRGARVGRQAAAVSVPGGADLAGRRAVGGLASPRRACSPGPARSSSWGSSAAASPARAPG